MSEDGARIARLIPGASYSELPLGPEEGFILSCVDGGATVQEISDATGLPLERVLKVLQLVVDAGAAEWRQRRERRRPRIRSIVTKPPPADSALTLYDPKELDEPGVELPLQLRRQILDTYYQLADLTFYELLDLPMKAPKADIRSAYFRYSKVFHPDTQFRKELGTYKSKMEAIFNRMTEAYDVLGKKRRRAEYDAYAKLKVKTRANQASIARVSREARRLQQETGVETSSVDRPLVERASAAPPSTENPSPKTREASSTSASISSSSGSKTATRTSSSGSKAATKVSGSGSQSAVPSTEKTASSPIISRAAVSPPPPSESGDPAAADRDRVRQLMARKIAAATGRPLPPTTPPKSQLGDRGALLRGLAGSLKQVASHTGGVDRAEEHLENAATSEREENYLAALNSLRLAIAIVGEREDVVAEYDRVNLEYAKVMAPSYERQARYETINQSWADAALSWTRVCEGNPEHAEAHISAAEALVESNGDLTLARRLGLVGHELAPSVRSHAILGRIYIAAGMKLSAKREFEAALTLSPGSQYVKRLLSQAK